MDIHQNLKELGIVLPAASTPAAAYVMSAQTGQTIHLSGHITKKDGAVWVGQFGRNINLEDGKIAARSVALDLLATLNAACDGDLNKVSRIVKLVSLVNSTPDFTDQHLVTNGASELINQVFGDRGRHARSAFGVAQLPLGACLEIEMIVELK